MQICTHSVKKKIGLAVVGYNSLPEIDRCLDGWVGHVDAMIVGEGPFLFHPDYPKWSTDGWLEHVEKRYGNISGLELVTYRHRDDQIIKGKK